MKYFVIIQLIIFITSYQSFSIEAESEILQKAGIQNLSSLSWKGLETEIGKLPDIAQKAKAWGAAAEHFKREADAKTNDRTHKAKAQNLEKAGRAQYLRAKLTEDAQERYNVLKEAENVFHTLISLVGEELTSTCLGHVGKTYLSLADCTSNQGEKLSYISKAFKVTKRGLEKSPPNDIKRVILGLVATTKEKEAEVQNDETKKVDAYQEAAEFSFQRSILSPDGSEEQAKDKDKVAALKTKAAEFTKDLNKKIELLTKAALFFNNEEQKAETYLQIIAIKFLQVEQLEETLQPRAYLEVAQYCQDIAKQFNDKDNIALLNKKCTEALEKRKESNGKILAYDEVAQLAKALLIHSKSLRFTALNEVSYHAEQKSKLMLAEHPSKFSVLILAGEAKERAIELWDDSPKKGQKSDAYAKAAELYEEAATLLKDENPEKVNALYNAAVLRSTEADLRKTLEAYAYAALLQEKVIHLVEDGHKLQMTALNDAAKLRSDEAKLYKDNRQFDAAKESYAKCVTLLEKLVSLLKNEDPKKAEKLQIAAAFKGDEAKLRRTSKTYAEAARLYASLASLYKDEDSRKVDALYNAASYKEEEVKLSKSPNAYAEAAQLKVSLATLLKEQNPCKVVELMHAADMKYEEAIIRETPETYADASNLYERVASLSQESVSIANALLKAANMAQKEAIIRNTSETCAKAAELYMRVANLLKEESPRKVDLLDHAATLKAKQAYISKTLEAYSEAADLNESVANLKKENSSRIESLILACDLRKEEALLRHIPEAYAKAAELYVSLANLSKENSFIAGALSDAADMISKEADICKTPETYTKASDLYERAANLLKDEDERKIPLLRNAVLVLKIGILSK